MKKKWLFAATMALAMTAFAVPAMAQEVDSTEAFEQALADNVSEITLNHDITLEKTAVIDNGVTINGNGHTITYSNTAQSYVFDVGTGDAVTFKNLVVQTTGNNKLSGIKALNCVPNITLDDVKLSVSSWGIAFNPSGRDGKLTVQNGSVIQNTRVDEYDTEAAYGDYRGISLWDAKHATITVDSSTIQGFGYTINLAGVVDENGVRDFEGATVNITNSTLMGWTAFNVWSSDTYFNITDSTLKGINNSDGPTDGFATIVVNDDIYGYGWGTTETNNFTITGGTITNYRSGSASERLFRVDDLGITQIQFVGNRYPGDTVKIIDGTGDSDSVFYAGNRIPTEEWMTNMTQNVIGEVNCSLTAYTGQSLTLLPTM